MSNCNHIHPYWACGWANPAGNASWNCSDAVPYSRWRHPISCAPAYYSCAGAQDGPTLVIHTIPLEAGCEQSCTPRTYRVRITGPSYPCGEIFTLRAGSCLELDEPLVISGLTPGTYCIEALYDCPHTYIHTITGASCGGCVQVTESAAPTVVTIVSRRRFCRRNRCGCAY